MPYWYPLCTRLLYIVILTHSLCLYDDILCREELNKSKKVITKAKEEIVSKAAEIKKEADVRASSP